jgi:hypothetical protein
VLSTAVDAGRRILAIIVALLAISGGVYLGGHPLKMDGYIGPGGFCTNDPFRRVNFPVSPNILLHALPRSQPCALGRFAWQAPVAVLVALAGLGTAVVLASSFRPRRPVALHRV